MVTCDCGRSDAVSGCSCDDDHAATVSGSCDVGSAKRSGFDCDFGFVSGLEMHCASGSPPSHLPPKLQWVNRMQRR